MKKMMFVLSMIVVAGYVFAANEITISAGIVAAKGYASAYEQPGSLQITWNGDKVFSTSLLLTTNPVAMSKGGVGNLGYVFARNIDLTNDVALSIGGVTNLIFKPGEYALFRLATNFNIATLFANSISNSASTNSGKANFKFSILED